MNFLEPQTPSPAPDRSTAPALLFPEDVAAIWTEERRKEEGSDAAAVKVSMVHDFLRWSNATPVGVKRRHRYEGHPMPYPRGIRGPRRPVWHGDQAPDLRAWWHDRHANAPRDPEVVADRKREWEEARTGTANHTSTPKEMLFPEDVTTIWTEERRAEEGPDAPEVAVATVHSFLLWSHPTPTGNRRRHRYEDHPMPYPRRTWHTAGGGRQPAWGTEQEDDLRAWWHDRRANAPHNDERLKQREHDWKEALRDASTE
ncbi:hypothetical protein [Actinoplanes derwentensis]|uniref:hypothetical protein n=1 Tax=Actinoplanes derwentensis TaxID=113562 RepID=UPI000B831B98|nr:hypothetical protein [Actinoplanes derwentensis]